MDRRKFIRTIAGALGTILIGPSSAQNALGRERTAENDLLELKTFTRSLLNKINSNRTQGDPQLSEELLEDLSTRIPAQIRDWSSLWGIELKNKRLMIQYLIAIFEKETKINFDFKKTIKASVEIPFIGSLDQDIVIPDNAFGSTLGIAQISQDTYNTSLTSLINNLVQRYNSSPEQKNQIQRMLLRQLQNKSGTAQNIDFSTRDPETVIREIVTIISPKHDDKGAYTDSTSGLEISVITYLHHIDYISKTYNINPESSEFRRLLFASWNAGISRPRNAYLQYVIYSYGEQKNPVMIRDSFKNNPRILEMMGMSLEDIEATESFAGESYRTFIDGNISKVEIDMITRIVIENPLIAQKYGIQVSNNFEDTQVNLISSFFETKDMAFFSMKDLNSTLVDFIEEVSFNLQIKDSSNFLAQARAAIPATGLNRTVASMQSLELTDEDIREGETTLDYVNEAEGIFTFLNPWNPNNP